MTDSKYLQAAQELAPYAGEVVSERRPPGDLERTSFRLASVADAAKEWLTTYLHESQRAILDRVPAYLDVAAKAYTPAQLRPILDGLTDQGGDRKTYLVSAQTLQRLNKHADRLGVARDTLLAFALLGMQVLLEQETDKARERRAAALDEVREIFDQAEALEGRLRSSLGADDPALRRLGEAVTLLSMLVDDLDEEQRTGQPLPKSFH